MNKPWYKSLKKWLGILFSVAVIIGGTVDIVRTPENTVDILQLWGVMSLTFLGVTSAIKLGHKIIDKGESK